MGWWWLLAGAGAVWVVWAVQSFREAVRVIDRAPVDRPGDEDRPVDPGE